jgi:hypothetical protein
MGKYKAPPISHRFFFNGEFRHLMKNEGLKGCKLSKGVFEKKSENLPDFDGEKSKPRHN